MRTDSTTSENARKTSESGDDRRPQKPEKPTPGYPLFAHATRRWAKKIRGKMHYFGPWDDPSGALKKWNEQKEDLLAGRVPRPKTGGYTIRDLVNDYLNSKLRHLEAGAITHRTFNGYKLICSVIVDAFGPNRLVSDLLPEDFGKLRHTLASKSTSPGAFKSPASIQGDVGLVRTIFRWASDNQKIDRPVVYGSEFNKPTKKELRKARAEKGPRMLTPEQLRTIINAARPHHRAMILLALNCGFGNTDVAQLRERNLDLASGWVDYPRVKTGMPRRAKLWPETVAALRETIARRPRPRDKADANLVFVTKKGMQWVTWNGKGWVDNVTIMFGNLLRRLGMKRNGVNFYALRHVFRTVADGCRDQPAINNIMGHSDGSMSESYREMIDDDRLVAVTDHVHAWLFAGADDDQDVAADESADDAIDEEVEKPAEDDQAQEDDAPHILRMRA